MKNTDNTRPATDGLREAVVRLVNEIDTYNPESEHHFHHINDPEYSAMAKAFADVKSALAATPQANHTNFVNQTIQNLYSAPSVLLSDEDVGLSITSKIIEWMGSDGCPPDAARQVVAMIAAHRQAHQTAQAAQPVKRSAEVDELMAGLKWAGFSSVDQHGNWKMVWFKPLIDYITALESQQKEPT